MIESKPKQRLRIKDADLPKEYLEALGDIVVSWGYVSNLVETAIWGLLGLTAKQGAALTAPIFFASRLEMLRHVGLHFFADTPHLQTFKDLHKTIGDTYSKRNVYEHSTWQHLHPEMPVMKVRVRKNTIIEPQAVKLDDIQDFGQEVIRLMMELNNFMEAHIPAPLPNK
jgi:hypothetical protein